MNRYSECLLSFVIDIEDGIKNNKIDLVYTNKSSDRGGKTVTGVTEKSYRRWKNDPSADVRKITVAEIELIYLQDYWVPAKCDLMPQPLDLLHFDACVNHGVSGGSKLLQQALGVDDDGKIGQKSLKALQAQSDRVRDLCNRQLDARLALYEQIIKGDKSGMQKKNERGWKDRVKQLRILV